MPIRGAANARPMRQADAMRAAAKEMLAGTITTYLAPEVSHHLLRTVPNKGKEAMAYLTAIIVNYYRCELSSEHASG